MTDHQPILSGYRGVPTETHERGWGQNQARCACGWRGTWLTSVQDVESELRDHLDRNRPPL